MTDLHLLSGSDERFAPGLLVAVGSALLHLPPGTSSVVHILDGGLTASSRERLEKLCGRLGSRATFHPVDTEGFAAFQPGAGGSRMYYARLRAAEFVPASRVVYFDADMVVLADLRKLARSDMSGHIAFACADRKVARLADDCPWPLTEEEKQLTYFNSGFMLIDLDAWRAARISETALALAARPDSGYKWHDQSVLNHALRGRTQILPPMWNWQYELVPDPWPEEGAVLHFTSSKKPWNHYGADLRHRIWRTLHSALGGSTAALFLKRREFRGLAFGLFENLLHRIPAARRLYLRCGVRDPGTRDYYTQGPGGAAGERERSLAASALHAIRTRCRERLT